MFTLICKEKIISLLYNMLHNVISQRQIYAIHFLDGGQSIVVGRRCTISMEPVGVIFGICVVVYPGRTPVYCRV